MSDWTSIRISTNNNQEKIQNLLALEDEISKKNIGQDHAINKILHTVRISPANIGDEQKPIGVLFLAGDLCCIHIYTKKI